MVSRINGRGTRPSITHIANANALRQEEATAHELQQAMYDNNKVLEGLWECVRLHREKYPDWKQFYVVLLTKRERLLHNVIRSIFLGRQSCPTPTSDQSVFRYTVAGDNLEYIWTVPDLETMRNIRSDLRSWREQAPHLVEFTQAFFSGELDQLCYKLNKEPLHVPNLKSHGLLKKHVV